LQGEIERQGMRLMAGTEDNAAGAGAAAGITAAARHEHSTPKYTLADNIEFGTDHPGPILGFHGTNAWDDFGRFDIGRSADIGTHFGTREQANRFAGRTLDYDPGVDNAGQRVFPARLNIHNPLTIGDLGIWNPNDVLNSIVMRIDPDKRRLMRRLLDEMADEKILRRHGGDGEDSDVMYEFFSPKKGEFDHLRELLDDLGYDSIRYWNQVEGRGYSYIVWQPNLVRSATSPSVTLQARGGSVPAPSSEDRDGKTVDARRR
jgi:hypothetical protein